jgi:hypothetical protein
MAFQGNLRDFSVSEVLQMIGTQKKTGCLIIEWNAARAHFYVLDGKLVATREPGMSLEDPLLQFLRKAHRLSTEQHRGIMTIQRESSRDLEDLLVNGRYIDAEELGGWIERQILEDLMRVMAWQNGSYRFDPMMRWPNPPLARLSVEGALIEVARRQDEQRRFADLRKDPLRLLGVRDLPDTEQQLSEEECDLFGIIDGRHTVTEIVESAPMSEYEAYEALHRMLEANWIEFVGRRDVAAADPAAGSAESEAATKAAAIARPRLKLGSELVVATTALVLALALAWGGHVLRSSPVSPAATDLYRASSLRDLRFALELYHRERGRYPAHLEELITDRWITREQVRLAGPRLRYATDGDHRTYTLDPGARQPG